MFPTLPFRPAPRTALRTRRPIVIVLAACAASLGLRTAAAQPTAPVGEAGVPPVLTHTYYRADGSVLSMRAVGNTIVGFSQDSTGQQSFIFNGTRSGTTISGQYYSVPKGASTTSGPLTFTFSNGGSTLTRTGGDPIGNSNGPWIAWLPHNLTFPQAREAKFQSARTDDMDGAYKGSDGSRAYARQKDNVVVYMAERFAAPGDARPQYARVVIAQRNGATLSGTSFDLPHQTAPLQAPSMFIGQRLTGSRDFSNGIPTPTPVPGYVPPSPLVRYTADYAVDLDVFEQQIQAGLAPFAVGYTYAIAQNGKVVRSNAGGWASRTTVLGEPAVWRAFTTDTLVETASATKTVTLVAMLKALRERGISVNSPVSPYLPAAWVRGPGMPTVTFRELLSHGLLADPPRSLVHPGDICENDHYGCLREAVAGGMTVTPANYNNIHYVLCRLILPFVVDPAGMAALFTSPADEALRNHLYSSAFRNYVRAMLLGIGVDADFKYVYGPGEQGANRYRWGPPVSHVVDASEITSLDDYLETGSGGLKMTAKEYARFLSKLEAGAILNAADLLAAKQIGFGEEGPLAGPGGVGPLWMKAGGASGIGSQAMVFPGTEVFVAQNSTGHPTQQDRHLMLRTAWQNSLVNTSF